jgi:hypothetical protein
MLIVLTLVPVLDQYRITALEKLSPRRPPSHARRLTQPCRNVVPALGARKRQHEARWTLYSAKAQHYQQQLADVLQAAATL